MLHYNLRPDVRLITTYARAASFSLQKEEVTCTFSNKKMRHRQGKRCHIRQQLAVQRWVHNKLQESIARFTRLQGKKAVSRMNLLNIIPKNMQEYYYNIIIL